MYSTRSSDRAPRSRLRSMSAQCYKPGRNQRRQLWCCVGLISKVTKSKVTKLGLRSMKGTAPAVGAFVELEFPPPNGHGWERGVVQSVTLDARYFYVAYAADGEEVYKVDVDLSSWRRAVNTKRKKKVQCVGSGNVTPRSQQIEKLKVKRADGMGHGLFSVVEIAADSLIVRMVQPTPTRSQRQVTARGLPHDSVVWLGAKRSRGVFDNALTAVEARWRPSWYKMNHAWAQSHTCNVEMRYDVSEGLGWWARRKITPPEQLFYDYGEAPSSWT